MLAWPERSHQGKTLCFMYLPNRSATFTRVDCSGPVIRRATTSRRYAISSSDRFNVRVNRLAMITGRSQKAGKPMAPEARTTRSDVGDLRRGTNLLNCPWLNKGTAFTNQERRDLGLHGLLPPHVENIGEHSNERAMTWSATFTCELFRTPTKSSFTDSSSITSMK